MISDPVMHITRGPPKYIYLNIIYNIVQCRRHLYLGAECRRVHCFNAMFAFDSLQAKIVFLGTYILYMTQQLKIYFNG